MTRLVYAPLALDDLRDIALYIAADNPARAMSFVDELRDKAARIAQYPLAHPARDELVPGLRSAPHGRYLLFYRVLDDAVRIERVPHGARHLAALFGGSEPDLEPPAR